MRRVARQILTGAGLVLALAVCQAGIATSKHNLTATGPGTIKAATEVQTCVFCHAPHNASTVAPLWNRNSPGGAYIPYTSSSAIAHPGQPTGASLLCLSCHDGTIALGDVLSRGSPISMAGGVTTMPAGNSNLGTNLSDDHPISFVYDGTLAAAHNGELADPAVLTGKVKLDPSGQMQCTSCHDPHDDSNGKFLVMPNFASALCKSCHLKNLWSTSDHALSSKTWNGVGSNPWPHTSAITVAGNACESCHRPHSADGSRWLLNAAAEESNCYPCHNGNVARVNIETEFTTKPWYHPIATTTGVHDVTEAGVVQARHVECSDCHNPHATNAGAGALAGSLANVRGIDINGVEVKSSTYEYQICFRCHADSTNQPAQHTTRQIVQTNTRLEFATTSPSYHPVAGLGKNTNVPTLLAPWTITSMVKCSDCHNNDSGPGAGGLGPKGPHGSTNPALLERTYLTADRTPESATAYALCYKCHDRTKLIGAGSAFVRHGQHIRDLSTPCNVCHDPHGISSTQGNSTNNSKLINFDLSVVRPSSSGQLKFVSAGTNRGSCYLTCHGSNHNPFTY
jgi:predicted CXXCH cytochrome family protein